MTNHESLTLLDRSPASQDNLGHLPPSQEGLHPRRKFSFEEEADIQDLMPLAEELATNPEKAQWLRDMMWLTMGSPDRERRNNGDHPWPRHTLENGEERVYTVPVAAGIMLFPDSRMPNETVPVAISIMKDHWQGGPDAWMIAKLNLSNGQFTRHEALKVTIEEDRQQQYHLDMTIKTEGYDSQPPAIREALLRQNPSRLPTIHSNLDGNFHSIPKTAWYQESNLGSEIIDL